MNKNPSLVEINGKRYDILTGRPIGTAKKAVSQSPTDGQGGSMDGFMRPPVIGKLKPASRSAKRVIHSTQRKVQRSKTLMRKIVKKPRGHISHHLKPRARTLGRNSARDNRARQVKQHHRVTHFGFLSGGRNHKSNQPAKEGEVVYQGRSRSSTMALSARSTAVISTGTHSHQRVERLLDYALAKADAHKKARVEARRGPTKLFRSLPKWLNLTIIIVGLLVVGGFIAWQKLPQASLKFAGTAAHVKAVMPSYTPDGYAADGPVKVENGVVMMTYKAVHDDSKTYTVKEQPSNQDHASAIANSAAGAVQTTQNRGVSISIIKDGHKNKAVCTNEGRQTTLEDNAGLPPSVINSILNDIC